ncbi:hypothetical protein ILYODFUR_007715 [Ilyodon furcidens]|uniref:Uncharacterized protein n=1 Tax=Ilyodon furcidens TaxID=33524 RepID=A0ABV0V4T3_9TELE
MSPVRQGPDRDRNPSDPQQDWDEFLIQKHQTLDSLNFLHFLSASAAHHKLQLTSFLRTHELPGNRYCTRKCLISKPRNLTRDWLSVGSRRSTDLLDRISAQAFVFKWKLQTRGT